MIQNGLMQEESRIKRIFVRMLYGLCGFTLGLSIIYILLGLYPAAWLNLTLSVCSPAAILMVRGGYLLPAKILMHLLVLLVVLMICAIFGNECMILAFMVPLVQSALTIFNRQEWPFTVGYLLLILFSVPWMILTDFRLFPIGIEGSVLKTIQLIDVVGAIGFSVMQISYASWVNNQFREALEMRNHESESTNQLLKSALSTRDQLFNMLAHDLRSPFVTLESGLIILEDIEIPDNKKWIIKEIRDNARNTLTLLDNTLNWARSQTNNIRFEPHEFPLQDLLNKIHQNFQLILRAKGVQLHMETRPGMEVYADPNMLQSILHNLISNAIKFSPNDSNIWVSAIGLPEGIEFRVRDSGTGMTADEVNQILSGGTFSKPGTRKEKGHGVGLLLVREFLHYHHAALSIRSAPEMGTEMSFVLRHQVR